MITLGFALVLAGLVFASLCAFGKDPWTCHSTLVTQPVPERPRRRH